MEKEKKSRQFWTPVQNPAHVRR